mmetsp:Transcript_92133/g.264058  ORF Transcript_92133/g.264058 Transcript_92133/m.264058 type:complete len:248 (+) Transcript_92133:980-1723(+)
MASMEISVGFCLETSVLGLTSISLPVPGSTMAMRLLGVGVGTGLSLSSSAFLARSAAELDALPGGAAAEASASPGRSSAGGGCFLTGGAFDAGASRSCGEFVEDALPLVGACGGEFPSPGALACHTFSPAPPPRCRRPLPPAGEGGTEFAAAASRLAASRPVTRPFRVVLGVLGCSPDGESGNSSTSGKPNSSLVLHTTRKASDGLVESPSPFNTTFNLRSPSRLKIPAALWEASCCINWGSMASTH